MQIVSVCQEAALAALHEDIHSTVVCNRHFDGALDTVKPQTDVATIQFYENCSKPRSKVPVTFTFCHS